MHGDKSNDEAEKLCIMSKELNEIKDEATKLNSIIGEWKANYEYLFYNSLVSVKRKN